MKLKNTVSKDVIPESIVSVMLTSNVNNSFMRWPSFAQVWVGISMTIQFPEPRRLDNL